MKKILVTLTLALFMGSMVSPILAQDPPKDKKVETTCAKKCEPKDSTKCTKEKDKKECPKSSSSEKSGCCKNKATAQKK